jgi:hypothetical protein
MSTNFSADLCNRVEEELGRFKEVFSAAQKDETPQNLEELADAADRVMRAVGRVLIEARHSLGDAGPKSRA